MLKYDLVPYAQDLKDLLRQIRKVPELNLSAHVYSKLKNQTLKTLP
ncbi:MAG: hypothetical protein ACD_65C00129G0003 [uncultured bacterium]|nr:MAG: hypothetical protein ACD_65C00129G0003 [uncultured bacterium]KKT01896.1 MAG: hypothetical protein UV80_C0007G0010 [Candidatus Peregrinibacteria bacterium GW2011_GWF2_43_17]